MHIPQSWCQITWDVLKLHVHSSSFIGIFQEISVFIGNPKLDSNCSKFIGQL